MAEGNCVCNDSAVRILGLEISTRIGCSSEERREPQRIEIDIDLEVPGVLSAGISGRLEDSVSYLEVRNSVRSLVATRSWSLVEEVAVAILDRLFVEFPSIDAARITVSKFVLEDCRSAGVTLARRQSPETGSRAET